MCLPMPNGNRSCFGKTPGSTVRFGSYYEEQCATVSAIGCSRLESRCIVGNTSTEEYFMKYPETARRASAMALSVFLLVVGLVRETVSQTASSSSPPADEQPIMLNQSWELAPAEILRLKEDALN